MIKSLILVACLPIFFACGKPAQKRPDSFFDPELLPYFYDFMLEARAHLRDTSAIDDLIVMRFDENLPQGVAGVCDIVTMEVGSGLPGTSDSHITWREIHIDRKEKREDGRFKVLVYHELAHCGLNAEHDLENPRAIMAPYLPATAADAEEVWEIAVAELMATRPGPPSSATAKSDPETPYHRCDLHK